MSKPTLNVPGIDPARIECLENDGRQEVRIVNGGWVAALGLTGVSFSTRHDNACCKVAMIAAFDHWRATGRLFPEPPPEPVECVCGGKAKVRIDGEFMFCSTVSCHLRANTVEQWNIMQAALKAAKEGK